ncbi:MAG: hypothetical protein EOO85_25120 [Pedobacter sp.]|nr:MAG: hypothetical protein EOO85_25120 [Pedobacter sp.]
MNFKWLSILIILFFNTTIAKSAEGCLIGTQLHTLETTSALGVTIAADLKVYRQQSTSCYSGSSSTAKACFVCASGGVVTLVVGATPLLYVVTCGNRSPLDLGYFATRGTYYSNYVLECPLDDYSWAFGASAAALGIFVIRKRKE